MTNALTTTSNAPGWLADIAGTLDRARPVAELLAKSDMVPKSYQGKPGDILIAAAMGARLGLDLFSSLAGIATVNGRPTLYGDAMLAVCQNHPAFDDMLESLEGAGDAQVASCTVKRKGRGPYTATFSAADAKRANLWGKQGPWSQMPQRMMAMRARSFALRGSFADALSGFHSREEMDDADLVDVTASATVRVPDATPAKVRDVPADKAPAKDDPAARGTEPVKEEPKQETGPTIASNDATAKRIAGRWGKPAISGIMEINARHGVTKLSALPAHRVEEAAKDLADLEQRLIAADEAAKNAAPADKGAQP